MGEKGGAELSAKRKQTNENYKTSPEPFTSSSVPRETAEKCLCFFIYISKYISYLHVDNVWNGKGMMGGHVSRRW